MRNCEFRTGPGAAVARAAPTRRPKPRSARRRPPRPSAASDVRRRRTSAATPAPAQQPRSPAPAATTPAFVDKVWRVAPSSAQQPGTTYTFLSGGALVIDAPGGTPMTGAWQQVDGQLDDGRGRHRLSDRHRRTRRRASRPAQPHPGEAVLIALVAAPAAVAAARAADPWPAGCRNTAADTVEQRAQRLLPALLATGMSAFVALVVTIINTGLDTRPAGAGCWRGSLAWPAAVVAASGSRPSPGGWRCGWRAGARRPGAGFPVFTCCRGGWRLTA